MQRIPIKVSRTARLFLYALGCVLGFAITAYGLLAYGDALFSHGTYTSRGDPTLRTEDRRLAIFGIIAFCYCLFGFMEALRSNPSDETASD